MMGGVRGNENRVEGRVLCDYCSCAVDNGEARDIICDCGRPLGEHVLMKIEQIEAIWLQGISLTICGEDPSEYPAPGTLTLVVIREDKPHDPCDEDFMKEISS